MSEKVQEAIAATRAGQKREAQFLLAEALQENPNDEHAWFLLGNLVDSPEKRMAYLGKALTINPDNEMARRQLVQVQRQAKTMAEAEAEPVVVMVEEDEATAVADDRSELPDWLADQLDDDSAIEVVDDEPEKMAVALDEEAEEPKEEMAVVKTAVSTPAKPTTTKTTREQQLRSYNQILAFLAILIIIVLIALIWSL